MLFLNAERTWILAVLVIFIGPNGSFIRDDAADEISLG